MENICEQNSKLIDYGQLNFNRLNASQKDAVTSTEGFVAITRAEN